ncbi:nascent polypeptide-associated complex protein [Natronomonas sp.]|uniref:nascent polypeptide-associated complex protein n=1 Tax=Natronomonas sp. TaxID=2184060 RepID=UPI00397575EE
MFGGGGGLNPRKMKQMMNQMGIDLEDIDAEEVIIRTAEEDLVFHDADVQRMDAQGQQTYQIVGKPESVARGDTGDDGTEADAEDGSDSESGFSDDDVEIVAMRTGVSEEKAREALEETGDLAAAVQKLE